MAYKNIRFYNFRNLADREVELNACVHYLVGENGAGKSSFIEGLYLLSYGSSFREKQLEHCLRVGELPFAVGGEIEQGSQRYQIQVEYGANKKCIRLDGKKLQDRKELLQITPSIVFAHGDIVYINGSPREKRLFIDQTISLLDPAYVDLLRDYGRCLVQRNQVLKHRQLALLPTYTLQMVEIGLDIQRRRARHIARLSGVFSDLFRRVSNFAVPVSIDYQPSWQQIGPELTASEAVQRCLEYLEQRCSRELLLGSSQSGPHRDQLQFSIEQGGGDFTKWASTGQLRLAALMLKSAQANYLQETSAYPGVLLLDDVLLEMDQIRRRLFLSSLPPYQQLFFTLLPNEDYPSYPFSDYQVLQLRNGDIEGR
ncbi:MAG: DNA replication and repair protein RecF [Spirochaetota bacterium]